ncbi:hypothetical protein [Elioraea tepidiphila]|jgi:hypothetical protein|uniref:hypothetical protein n=1 Tax=Elioraea tepidiphila TaxID=457934 RepID=UPI000363885D|nr:hypothetical protein [Elioraea tepidiphila]
METWQVIGLIWAAGALALVLPGLGTRLRQGQPVLRWGLIWLVAILGLVLAYEVLLALGLDVTPARRWRTAY